jgi:hypothetical protein
MIRLFKYRCFSSTIDRDCLQELLYRREIYCPTPPELDDPYDCNIGTADHLMGMLIKFGVFCACGDSHNDMLLFSHYAAKHTGLCLEFTVDDGGTIGDSTFLGFVKKVNYVTNFPQFTEKNIHQLLWTKHIAWRYQDELRTIADLEHDPSKFRQFKDHELTGIRFGLKMKEDDERTIARWAHDAGLTRVLFSKARLQQDQFQLVYDSKEYEK